MIALEDALTLLQAEKDALEIEAHQDQLTGIGNRRLLEKRASGRGGWFVLADLNGFKAAQDAHPRGHAYGDEVLIEFAEFLLSESRADSEDRVAVRLGGDEFVVWCQTKAGAERIQSAIRAWSSGPVSSSAGMGRDMESADANLYQDKRAA